MAFGFVRQSGGTMRLESTPGRGTHIVICMVRFAGDEAAS